MKKEKRIALINAPINSYKTPPNNKSENSEDNQWRVVRDKKKDRNSPNPITIRKQLKADDR